MPSEPVSAPLAKSLEACAEIREGVRHRGCLLSWPTSNSQGIASLKALSLNCRVLVVLARTHCGTTREKVKSPRIAWVRSEATWEFAWDLG